MSSLLASVRGDERALHEIKVVGGIDVVTYVSGREGGSVRSQEILRGVRWPGRVQTRRKSGMKFISFAILPSLYTQVCHMGLGTQKAVHQHLPPCCHVQVARDSSTWSPSIEHIMMPECKAVGLSCCCVVQKRDLPPAPVTPGNIHGCWHRHSNPG